MELLTNLGVNSTLWVQLGIFLFTYLVVTQLLFKPYLAAFNKRLELTEGNEQHAERLNAESTDLTVKFEHIAKDINTQIKHFYELAQKEGQAVQTKTLEASAQETEEVMKANRSKIQNEVSQARKDLKNSLTDLSKEIEVKFLGGDA